MIFLLPTTQCCTFRARSWQGTLNLQVILKSITQPRVCTASLSTILTAILQNFTFLAIKSHAEASSAFQASRGFCGLTTSL
jgi:hypothetical protein